MAFPSTLDSFTTKTNKAGVVEAGETNIAYASHINALQTAIASLEAKVGVDSSAVATSLDYLTKSASTINPGHHHSAVYESDNGAAALSADASGKLTIPGRAQFGTAMPIAEMSSVTIREDTIGTGDGTDAHGLLVRRSHSNLADASLYGIKVLDYLTADAGQAVGLSYMVACNFVSQNFANLDYSTNIFGVDGLASNLGSGSRPNVIPFRAQASVGGGGGALAINCYETVIDVVGGGTVTTLRGLYVKRPSNTGSTVVNSYGVDITNPRPSGAGASGAVYAINSPSAEPSLFGGSLDLLEMASAPAGVANQARIFAQDNGAGKTQLLVQFPTGAAIQLAIEAP